MRLFGAYFAAFMLRRASESNELSEFLTRRREDGATTQSLAGAYCWGRNIPGANNCSCRAASKRFCYARLENYTFLTPRVEIKKSNLYRGSTGAILGRFSNALPSSLFWRNRPERYEHGTQARSIAGLSHILQSY